MVFHTGDLNGRVVVLTTHIYWDEVRGYIVLEGDTTFPFRCAVHVENEPCLFHELRKHLEEAGVPAPPEDFTGNRHSGRTSKREFMTPKKLAETSESKLLNHHHDILQQSMHDKKPSDQAEMDAIAETLKNRFGKILKMGWKRL